MEPGLRKRTLRNTGWLISDSFFRIPASLILSVLMFRYLGPDQTGLWNFAIAFAGFFGILTGLGQDTIIVHDLVAEPESRDAIMGSGFYLKMAGGLIAIPSSLLAFLFIGSSDLISIILVGISSVGLAFGSFSIIDCFFQAKLLSRVSVIARNLSFIIFSILKLFLIFIKAPLIFFALANLGDIVSGFLLVIIALQKHNVSIRNWRFDRTIAIKILKDSLPLFISSFAIVLYTRIDVIMIGSIMDKKSVGIYSAAVKLSEAWCFIPSAIASSALPAIVLLKKESREKYENLIEMVILRCTQIGLLIAITTTIFSSQIINILYGSQYSASAGILTINIWGGLFIFTGIASVPYFTAENLQRFTLYRTLAGLAVNISLNLFLIPLYGPSGAAVTTVITQCVASYAFNALNKQTRPLFRYQTRALLFPFSKLFLNWKILKQEY